MALANLLSLPNLSAENICTFSFLGGSASYMGFNCVLVVFFSENTGKMALWKEFGSFLRS